MTVTAPLDARGAEVRAAWSAHAAELAAWAFRRLVNRTDAWGAYTPPEHRGREFVRRDGTKATVPANWTAPPKQDRGKVLLRTGAGM